MDCILLHVILPLLCLDSTAGLGVGATMFILVVVASHGGAGTEWAGAYHWIISRGLLVAYAIPLEEGLAYATLEHESQMILIALMGAFSSMPCSGKEAPGC